MADNTTINIDNYISIVNNVVSSVSTEGSLSGNLLTNKVNIIANGTSKMYYNVVDVAADFTVASVEYTAAVTYFNSFTISRKKPDFLIISGFLPGSATSPYLVTGQISQNDINNLKALAATGTFTLKINNTQYTATPDFSNAVNLVNIANILQASLITETSISTLTVTATNNSLYINTNQIGSQYTIDYGTDNSITPLIHASQNLAINLIQGKDSAETAEILNEIIAQNRNWVGLTTLFDYSTDSTYKVYLEIANWVSVNKQNFAFVPWIDDVTKAINFQNLVLLQNYPNITTVKGSYNLAVFILSEGASVDYSASNGRVNFAYKSGVGIQPTINTESDWRQLLNAGVSFYGKNSGMNNLVNYNFVFPVNTTGPFLHLDNFYNQVKLNDAIQTAFIRLLLNINTLEINEDGIVKANTAMKDVIKVYKNNGVIQTGNTFSNAVRLILTQQAGVDITSALTENGYYLQFIPPTSEQRAARQFGNINFWYTNGQGVLFINFVNTLVI